MISISTNDGMLKLFWNGKEVGAMYDGKDSIIRQVECNDIGQITVTVKNLLGGLWEAEHPHIHEVMANVVRDLKGTGIDLVLEDQIGEINEKKNISRMSLKVIKKTINHWKSELEAQGIVNEPDLKNSQEIGILNFPNKSYKLLVDCNYIYADGQVIGSTYNCSSTAKMLFTDWLKMVCPNNFIPARDNSQ
jgi:hypothetical protein